MNSFNLTYQTAHKEHLKQIQHLNQMLFDYEEKEFSPQYKIDWPMSQTGEDYFSKRIQDGKAFIALDGDTVVGYLCAGVWDTSYRSFEKIGEIENIFILEKYRNHGVGSRLVEQMKEYMRNTGIEHIRVELHHMNDQAKAFYQKNGLMPYTETFEMKI